MNKKHFATDIKNVPIPSKAKPSNFNSVPSKSHGNKNPAPQGGFDEDDELARALALSKETAA